MTEHDALIGSLKKMGINEDNYRVLALLPFVLVAWSDGKIQHAELKKILEIARNRDLLGEGGGEVLDGWLHTQPSDEYFKEGFRLLIELARRRRGVGASLSADTLQDLVMLSSDIARAAGGLFGGAWSVSKAEKEAIESVADILSIDDGHSWKELVEDLEG